MALTLPSRPALVIIDMQQAFDNPLWGTRWNADVDRNGQAVLAAVRKAGHPVVHVRHDSVEPGSSLGAGQPGNAFRPGFEPRSGEGIVSKSVNAAFIGTDLDLRLRRLRIDGVLIFGITTDQCVSTTTRVGANMGWPMVLVEDACDCFGLPDGRGGTIEAEAIHAAHVATLRAEFATIVTTAEVVETIS